MTALQTGCRLIDTAACCGNKRAAGEAVRESEIAREERLLTYKIWIRDADTAGPGAPFLPRPGRTDDPDQYLIRMPCGDSRSIRFEQ